MSDISKWHTVLIVTKAMRHGGFSGVPSPRQLARLSSCGERCCTKEPENNVVVGCKNRCIELRRHRHIHRHIHHIHRHTYIDIYIDIRDIRVYMYTYIYVDKYR